jgi:hypothetical protein
LTEHQLCRRVVLEQVLSTQLLGREAEQERL